MKTLTIRFEFPDTTNGVEVTHDDIIEIINGCVYDMDSNFANEVTYTIVDRK